MATDSRIVWTPDESQQQVINIRSGKHLVLAPPGCGKTQILAERIAIALDEGVKPQDMLCLTFTNRAARGMRERINDRVGEAETTDVFVGNVHRFCSKFLYENGIVPAESAIIDDDDAVSILARYMEEDEEKVSRDFRRKKAYSKIMFFSHFMFDIEHCFPKPLRMHPECVTREDIVVMKAICKTQGKPFDAEMMTDIYEHTDFYLDIINQPPFSPLLRQWAEQTLHKMRFAHAYKAYKQQNNLLDFEDLLQYTYAYLCTHDDYKRYAWVQVDEVQDLNMLQLEIIKEIELTPGDLTPSPSPSERGDAESSKPVIDNKSIASPLPEGEGLEERSLTIFFGDEQQAIFSFMGAKLATLNTLKEECIGNIHHLNVNHRCPKTLLDMLNAYAVANLGGDPALLPKTDIKGKASPLPEGEGLGERPLRERSLRERSLFIKSYENIWSEFNGVANLAAKFEKSLPDTTTAIIVNSNHDADEISNILLAGGHPHFKVSGTDIFSRPEVKLLLAHLSLLNNDRNFLAWARIMHGLKVCETPASSRQFVYQLRKRAITPSEFLDGNYDNEDNLTEKTGFNLPKTYLMRFVETYETSDIVVFDTETTGLDVFNDDIIQIAAERIRQGKSIAKFSVYIETDKTIPAMLGDIVNPIIEERKHQHIYSHKEALQMFLDFADGSPLLAHNANFDTHILYFNLRRYLEISKNTESGVSALSLMQVLCNGATTDSLKLIRLLRPDLKAYKLKLLLKELGLSGENSHLADDDVNATVSLVNYCYEKARGMLPSQKEYLARKTTKDRIERLKKNYAEFYKRGMSNLYIPREDKDAGGDEKTGKHEPALVEELRSFYKDVMDAGWIKPVEKIDYIFRYLSNDVIDEAKESTLVEQLSNHIMEINTFKEADLCGSSTITDRLFVSTIHKAKGLEFDNVLVFDVVDGRIPNYYNENDPSMLAEDARKLYVAMSRAKQRLYICYSKQGPSSGAPARKLSRFLTPVKKMFTF